MKSLNIDRGVLSRRLNGRASFTWPHCFEARCDDSVERLSTIVPGCQIHTTFSCDREIEINASLVKYDGILEWQESRLCGDWHKGEGSNSRRRHNLKAMLSRFHREHRALLKVAAFTATLIPRRLPPKDRSDRVSSIRSLLSTL